MIDKNDTQKLSLFLAKSLKEKNVKHSEILEIISHFNGFADWNSFSAQKGLADKNYLKWTSPIYVHKDNGGLTLSYNPFQQTLSMNAGFFGYSEHEVYVPMKFSELKLLKNAVSSKINGQANGKFNSIEITENLKIEDWLLIYKDMNSTFIYSLLTYNNSEVLKLISALDKIVENVSVLKNLSNLKVALVKSDISELPKTYLEDVQGIYKNGKDYTCKVKNIGSLKLADCIFYNNNELFDLKGFLD